MTTKPETLRVAAAQISSAADPQTNLAAIADALGRADGADLVVLPEASMACFGTDLRAVAQPIHGAWANDLRELARQAGTVVVVGMFEPAPDGRVYNTLLATGPGVDAAYRKIHLFDAFGARESDLVAPGRERVVIEVGGVRVGLATCFDPAVRRPIHCPRPRRRRTGGGASILGCRPGQGGAMGSAHPGSGNRRAGLAAGLRPGMGAAHRKRPARSRPQRAGRPARRGARPTRAAPGAFARGSGCRGRPNSPRACTRAVNRPRLFPVPSAPTPAYSPPAGSRSSARRTSSSCPCRTRGKPFAFRTRW